MSDESETKEPSEQPRYHNEVDKDGNEYSVLRNGLVLCTSLAAALSPKNKMTDLHRKHRKKNPTSG